MGSDSTLDTMPTEVKAPPSSRFQSTLAVFLWLSGIHFNVFLLFLALFCLPSAWAFTLLGFLLVLMVVPLYENSQFASVVAKFICKHAPSHFPITLMVEDMKAFDPNQAYILAAEPHSVLPIGILALCNHTGNLPLNKIKALATSVVFISPFLRHIWSWMGLVPASRKVLLKLLNAGYTCIVIPGGVREMFFMQKDREVVYLRKRYGFVSAAMETGSPLVPCFIFGQTHVYQWWRPKGKLFDDFSRAVGFTPLAFWGIFGSPMPYRQPMYVAVGKPIEVNKITQPSKEEVEEVHAKFISSIKELFEKHKQDAGYKDTSLYVL